MPCRRTKRRMGRRGVARSGRGRRVVLVRRLRACGRREMALRELVVLALPIRLRLVRYRIALRWLARVPARIAAASPRLAGARFAVGWVVRGLRGVAAFVVAAVAAVVLAAVVLAAAAFVVVVLAVVVLGQNCRLLLVAIGAEALVVVVDRLVQRRGQFLVVALVFLAIGRLVGTVRPLACVRLQCVRPLAVSVRRLLAGE